MPLSNLLEKSPSPIDDRRATRLDSTAVYSERTNLRAVGPVAARHRVPASEKASPRLFLGSRLSPRAARPPRPALSCTHRSIVARYREVQVRPSLSIFSGVPARSLRNRRRTRDLWEYRAVAHYVSRASREDTPRPPPTVMWRRALLISEIYLAF